MIARSWKLPDEGPTRLRFTTAPLMWTPSPLLHPCSLLDCFAAADNPPGSISAAEFTLWTRCWRTRSRSTATTVSRQPAPGLTLSRISSRALCPCTGNPRPSPASHHDTPIRHPCIHHETHHHCPVAAVNKPGVLQRRSFAPTGSPVHCLPNAGWSNLQGEPRDASSVIAELAEATTSCCWAKRTIARPIMTGNWAP